RRGAAASDRSLQPGQRVCRSTESEPSSSRIRATDQNDSKLLVQSWPTSLTRSDDHLSADDRRFAQITICVHLRHLWMKAIHLCALATLPETRLESMSFRRSASSA